MKKININHKKNKKISGAHRTHRVKRFFEGIQDLAHVGITLFRW